MLLGRCRSQEPPFAVEGRERMKIGNFINNKKLVDDWLAEQARSLEMAGFSFSHWPHHDGLGFGIVITADKSGEFHLMPNCDVCSHVERYNPQTHGFDVLHSDWRPTAHFHEFEQLYYLFKKNVIS
ncbi:hypothetical protein LP419_34230 [Massilia sp. H-1]|nr:hypothetical protein LP419_34230 [Massilia sp. H-1]